MATEKRSGAADRPVSCPSCGSSNPVGHALCFICGRSMTAAPASRKPMFSPSKGPTTEARRAYQDSMATEAGVVRFLRFLYLLYAVGYLYLSVRVLIGAQLIEIPGTLRLLIILQPLVSLVLVVVAIRRLDDGPFAWALVMAGMETLALVQALIEEENVALHGTATALLWVGVFACVRSASTRMAWAEGRAGESGGIGDYRIVASLLLLYGGVFGLLYFVPGDVEAGVDDLPFWGGIILLGVVAALVAGGGVLADSCRFQASAAHLKPTLTALGLVLLLNTVFLSWIVGDFFPSLPQLAWPGTAWLVWMCLAPGVFEEWLCRGVMWSCIRERATTMAVVIATATLFALMHGLGRGAWGLSTVLPQLAAGAIFGVLRAKTGSLVPSMVVHAVGNFYIGAWVEGWQPPEDF